jgi:hypothetical protein
MKSTNSTWNACLLVGTALSTTMVARRVALNFLTDQPFSMTDIWEISAMSASATLGLSLLRKNGNRSLPKEGRED